MESTEMEVDTTEGAEVEKSSETEVETSVNPKDPSDLSAFPSIEINSAETISEDAFDEDKTEETSENLFKDYDSTFGITQQEAEKDPEKESEESQSKEQEPVNESNESDSKAFDDSVVNSEAGIKQEADIEGDVVPNEDPNRDAADSDQEMDPEVAAALEASLLETEQMDEEQAEEEERKKKEGGNGPMMMFRNETEVDSTEDDSLADPDVVTENALTGDEMTLDGEAVTGDMEIGGAFSLGDGNPLEAGDGNPLDEDPGDYDPLVEDGGGIGVDVETSGFLDQVNSGFMTQIHAFPETNKTRGTRGPYRKKSFDDDYDPLAPVSATKTTRKSARGTLQCNICHFPFQSCIGDLKLHKYTDHDNQPKPSYLDLAEVAISKLSAKNGGVSTQKILKEILSDPMTTDGNAKAKNILARALKFGLSSGRLRSGKPGKKCQRYFLAKKGPNRKSVFDKFNKNKKLVEFDDKPAPKPKPKPVAPKESLKVPSNITVTRVRSEANSKAGAAKPKPIPKHADSIGIPNNTSRFGRGKRSAGTTVTLDSDSDSDIEIVSEKITPKPKRKVTIVRVPANRPSSSGKPMVKPGSSKLPSNLVRVGSSKPGSKVIPKPGVTTSAKKEEKKSVWDEDDDDLTCRICQSAFWFKSQLTEHMEKTHNRSQPETKTKK